MQTSLQTKPEEMSSTLKRIGRAGKSWLTFLCSICNQIVDTRGKFAAGVDDTGGKLAASVVDTGGKLAASVVDTGGKFVLLGVSYTEPTNNEDTYIEVA